MQKRHQNKNIYFEEQVRTTRESVIPFIEKHRSVGYGTRVLEIGCGEGGNLLPFLEKKCFVTGIDISQSKIGHAENFLHGYIDSGNLLLIAKDIYEVTRELGEPYDLILMRDVIEHIHDQDKFMAFVKKFLKNDGVFFLAFPPWYNPFGGHQQICRNKFLSMLPYFHLFPRKIYKTILTAGGEDDQKILELMEIKETGISIKRFRKIFKKHGYTVLEEIFFIVNPNYKIKFGLKPRKQSRLISAIPFIRNVLSTAVYINLTLDQN